MFICLHNVSEYQFCKSWEIVSSQMQPEIEAPCDKSESMRTIDKNARDKYLIMMWMEIHNFEKPCTAYNFKCHFHTAAEIVIMQNDFHDNHEYWRD